jgi:predicted ATPase
VNTFRQFTDNSCINFKHPLTVLVGKNGSGKSTFLKLIKSISKGRNANYYFFETEWDKFKDKGIAEFQYKIEGKEFKESKTQHFDWVFSPVQQDLSNNKLIENYLEKPEIKTYTKIVDIEFKSLIGSFEKNIFFDNQTTKTDLKSKADYAKKVTKKVQQSIETKTNSGKKASILYVSTKNVCIINEILDKKYDEIKIIKHRFFNGTWGTSIIFNSGCQYSEANSGSGEFIVSNVVERLESIPNNSLLLLDEPELSLHPGAQKRLLEYFLDLIIKKKIQIILSTHSPSFVELIPNHCVKNFIINDNNKVIIEQGVNYLNAFDNLENSYDSPNVIVEDSLAKKILEKIIKNECLSGQFNVRYFSGGASSIKTSLITTFSKVDDNNRFFILDGDMYKCEVVDLSEVVETKKTIQYLENEIYKITGIRIKNFIFNVDGGVNGSNERQKIDLYTKYINFYKDKVLFMPKMIPEDIIFDRGYLKIIFPSVDLELVDDIKDSKCKFKSVSEQLNITVEVLYDVFITNFIFNSIDNESYKVICDHLGKILSLSKNIR